MGRFRDAVTGLFTTRDKAQASPATTVRETPRAPVMVNGRRASHYCNQCGALWRQYADGWSLVSASGGPCCGNATMAGQIIPLER